MIELALIGLALYGITRKKKRPAAAASTGPAATPATNLSTAAFVNHILSMEAAEYDFRSKYQGSAPRS